jgi:LacI family transcriptional regulator
MAVSIRDVARLAGVSVGTVSNVLNKPDEVSADSIARVQEAIDELGYVRNDAARRLRAGVSSTVGFVVLDGQNPFFNEVVRGAEDEASRHGIAILVGNTDEDPAREGMYLDLFEEQRVRGVLIAPYGDITRRLTLLRERGIPAVLVDRMNVEGTFSSVATDSVVGGRIAAEHLIETGRRRLAFVGGPFDIRQVRDRLDGARWAVESSDVDATIEVIATRALTVEEGRRTSAPTPSSPPTTSSPSGCCRASSSTARCSCRSRWRSSDSTTSPSLLPRPCRSRRCVSPAARSGRPPCASSWRSPATTPSSRGRRSSAPSSSCAHPPAPRH